MHWKDRKTNTKIFS